MNHKQNNVEILSEIERLIDGVGTIDENELVHDFISLSERKDIDKEIRSFILDAMLVAENDFDGEFKNVEDVRTRLSEIKKELANTNSRIAD